MPAQQVPPTRRLGRLVAGLAALVGITVLLVGAPLALVTFAGNPLPDHLPTVAEVTGALTRRDDGQLFLRVLAVLGWAGWATFALSVLVEIPARVLRLPTPRLPGLGTQQRLAGALVAGAMLLVTAGTPASAATPASTSSTTTPGAAPTWGATSAPGAVSPWGAGTAATGPDTAAGGLPAPGGSAAARDASVEATSGPVYRVRRGDYLGHVADRYLGDFERYRELAKINKLRNPDRILPGQRIRLPAEARDAGPREHATGSARGAVSDRVPSGRLPAEADRDEVPSGPFDPEAFTASAAAAAAVGTGGQGAADPGPATENRGRLALALAAVLAAAGMVGAQVAVLLGLRRRRAPEGAPTEPAGAPTEPPGPGQR
ncbi:MAG TPA: LysM domain-containing protein [Catenuloplanes sp.]|jgi:LysM repeat protein